MPNVKFPVSYLKPGEDQPLLGGRPLVVDVEQILIDLPSHHVYRAKNNGTQCTCQRVSENAVTSLTVEYHGQWFTIEIYAMKDEEEREDAAVEDVDVDDGDEMAGEPEAVPVTPQPMSELPIPPPSPHPPSRSVLNPEPSRMRIRPRHTMTRNETLDFAETLPGHESPDELGLLWDSLEQLPYRPVVVQLGYGYGRSTAVMVGRGSETPLNILLVDPGLDTDAGLREESLWHVLKFSGYSEPVTHLTTPISTWLATNGLSSVQIVKALPKDASDEFSRSYPPHLVHINTSWSPSLYGKLAEYRDWLGALEPDGLAILNNATDVDLDDALHRLTYTWPRGTNLNPLIWRKR